jgi:uncharacterized protein YjgD (DUF1641 family)
MTATMPETTSDDRLDALAAQVEWLVEDARARRLEQDRYRELIHDLTPVGSQFVGSLSDALVEYDVDLREIQRFFQTLVVSLPALDASLRQLRPIAELTSSASELTGDVISVMMDKLGEAHEKGYFAFAKAVGGVADEVVTSFSEEDVDALGENIVLILNTVKDMTQPEIMGLLQRTIHTVQDQEEPSEPPTVFGLLKEMRDPQVRRGLGRLLAVLRSMGQDT